MHCVPCVVEKIGARLLAPVLLPKLPPWALISSTGGANWVMKVAGAHSAHRPVAVYRNRRSRDHSGRMDRGG